MNCYRENNTVEKGYKEMTGSICCTVEIDRTLPINHSGKNRSSHLGSAEMNPTSIHADVGLIPGLAQWVKDSALL